MKIFVGCILVLIGLAFIYGGVWLVRLPESQKESKQTRALAILFTSFMGCISIAMGILKFIGKF